MSSTPSLPRPTTTTRDEPTSRTSFELKQLAPSHTIEALGSSTVNKIPEVTSPTTTSRKEAHRLNKKAELSKRKRNRYSFDLGRPQDGEVETLGLPAITESASRESSRPPSRAIHRLLNSSEIAMSDSKRLEQGQASGDTARDSDTRPTLEESTDRSTLILESPYAGVTTFNTSLPEPPLPTLQSATTLPVDTRNLLPLSIPGTPGMGASPSISRTASPAINPSPNASYHDSPRGSTSLDHDSDRAQRDRNGYGMAVTMTDATGSEFETEDDEVQTKTSLSVRMPWSRNTYSGHNASANPNSSWPWRTRRPTVDLLHSHNPTDHKHGHTRATSNEYSPLKKHGSNPSLADRHDSLATVSSSMHSSSSYGNPPSENAQSTTYSQYSDYSSMPDGLGDTPSSKDQLNPAIAAFSSELGKHRRGLRQALGWIKRRIGVGASGVVELASEASQRVAGTTGGTIRLPSGSLGSRRRRKKRKTVKGAVHDTSWLFNIVQLIPTQPWTILLAFLLFGAFAVSLTMSLKYLLNPDKAPLPWRDYCQSPHPDYFALDYPLHYNYTSEEQQLRLSLENDLITLPGASADLLQKINTTHRAWPFQGKKDMPYSAESSLVDTLEPVGLFIGVFTTDEGRERRMMIRQTYGSHHKSRVPGTEGVRIRFIMGRPRTRFERAVKLEMETFGDIVLLDIPENMNSGKTHAFFSWAADHAMVSHWDYDSPIQPSEAENDVKESVPEISPGRPQRHSRSHLRRNAFAVGEDMSGKQRHLRDQQLPSHTEDLSAHSDEHVLQRISHPVYRGEKRPDYIVKADEDTFIVLGELERRLRVAPRNLTYWGYLVKNLFMAGECYALSYDLAYFIGKAETFKMMTRGAEDKLVARWMRMHPRREEISWVSEKCWIYDHPKAGTVYAHGYLYPATVNTIRHENITELPVRELALRGGKTWATSYSTVSKFGAQYTPPSEGMTLGEEVEALVEGSEMSLLGRRSPNSQGSKKSGALDPHLLQAVYDRRPTRAQRFLNDSSERGGTAIVHFIKRQEWFMETALALLGPFNGGDRTPNDVASAP